MKLITAQTLDEAFVCMVEINLATLEEALTIKKSSKSRITRLKSICLDGLLLCTGSLVTHSRVRWTEGSARNFPRVANLITNKLPEAIERALEQHIIKVQGSTNAKSPELHPA